MSGGDDWQAGDLALCVRDHRDDGIPVTWEPFPGSVYTVAAFRLCAYIGDRLELCEDPDKFNPAGAWLADHFRKINPLTDEERNEFLADLRTPVREPAA